MTMPQRPELIERLRRSRKYGDIGDETLSRILEWAEARHGKPDAVLKAAKRKLHQVFGAYMGRVDLAKVGRIVDSLAADAASSDIESRCRKVLSLHPSTAERLDILAPMYEDLFRETGRPASVVDLACGLNPFTLPWMMAARAEPAGRAELAYYACDIDRGLVATVNRFLTALGRPETVETRDILVSMPGVEAELTLLLKTAPCLEQQEKGAFGRVLSSIRSPYVAVSFPTRSLGGRPRGMVEHYDRFMGRFLEERQLKSARLSYPTETVYVVETGRT